MVGRLLRKDRCVRAACVLMVVAASACTGAGGDGTSSPEDQPVFTPDPATQIVSGPLCEFLPGGDGPGNPASLTGEPANVVLEWIPVLTVYEAATRATGLDEELHEAESVTLLAPTDDAFEEVFSEATLDALLIFRRDELRALLDTHMIEGAYSMEELLEAGTVTTVAGDSITIEPAGDMIVLDGRAETVCGDYLGSNARIHVIDAVLGELPEPAEDDPVEGN